MTAVSTNTIRHPIRLATLRHTALLDTPAEEAFDRLTRLATKTLRVPFGLVSLVDADREFFKSCIGLPEPWASQREIPLSLSFSQHVVVTGAPLIIEDARKHPMVHDNLAIPELGVVAYLGIPLTSADGYTLGAVCSVDTKPRKWTEEEIDILCDLAAAVMTEIEIRTERAQRQRVEAKLRDNEAFLRNLLRDFPQVAAAVAADHTARLQEVTAAFSRALTLKQVAEVILNQGIAALGAMAGTVVLQTEDGIALEVLHAVGYPQEIMPGWQRFPIDGTTPLGNAVRTRQPILLESRMAGAARYPALAQMQTAFGDGAIVAFPLIVEERTLGGLGFSFAITQPFSTDALEFMHTLVQQCAQALERARIYEAEHQARTEAQEAVRMRDTFLSVVSHELKNQLASLLGYIQLLQRRAEHAGMFSEHDQRAFTVIAQQARRLNQLITDLLDVSRIHVGHLTLTRIPLDLGSLARRVVEEFQPSLKQHTLTYSGSDTPLMIEGDALRLEQVLQNLIQNAIKYSPSGGAVRVHVERLESRACISVTDDGIGIPETALPNLFQRFYRAANVDEQHISGLGVGLYVVKEVVTLHGGDVTVESTEGKGSTFTISLPLLAQDCAASAQQS